MRIKKPIDSLAMHGEYMHCCPYRDLRLIFIHVGNRIEGGGRDGLRSGRGRVEAAEAPEQMETGRLANLAPR
jgi:hypothetical protein